MHASISARLLHRAAAPISVIMLIVADTMTLERLQERLKQAL
jgi:hypothetical protein